MSFIQVYVYWLMKERMGVIPAKAGAEGLRSESTVVAAWIPAFAGPRSSAAGNDKLVVVWPLILTFHK
jgi:hypothetical protein